MVINEYIGKENSGKNRIFLNLQCDNCGAEYVRQKRFRASVDGCNPQCLSILKGTRITLTCSHCSKQFDRAKSKLLNSKSELYFCSRDCKDKAQSYIVEIQPSHYGTGLSSYRLKALNYYGSFCSRCGYSNIFALEVHHKDRNRENNEINNLEVLCCNCHKLEHRT
jgi:hypothetical protein